jgi:hypothetical protein
MEVGLNICHNFYIGHFDQRSMIFKLKLEFRLELELDRNLIWIYLYSIQIHDYNMISTRLHWFGSGMLRPSPLKKSRLKI